MGYVATLWGTLSMAMYSFILNVTCSLDANGSSSLSLSPEHGVHRYDASKNYHALTGQPRMSYLTRTRKDFGNNNFSLSEILSDDPNSETFEGFEFVDSPEVPPQSTDRISGVADRVNDGFIGRDRSRIIDGGGAIDRNLWKTYPNGTIIHDVHISLVHPANMAPVESKDTSSDGKVKPGGGRASFKLGSDESKDASTDGKVKSGINVGGIALAELVTVRSVSRQDATIQRTSTSDLPRTLRRASSLPESKNVTGSVLYYTTYTIPRLGSSAAAGTTLQNYSKKYVTTSPPAKVPSKSTVSVGLAISARSGTTNATSFAPSQKEDGHANDVKVPLDINVGFSIDATGLCFSDCMTKCHKTVSNVSISQAKHLPLCLPALFDSKGRDLGLNVSGKPLDADSTSTTPSVSMSHFEGGSDASGKLGKLNVEVASGLEIGMLKTKESTEPKLGFLLEDICLSEGCILKAADILRRMDRSVDPCDSFYKFACGGYFKSEIPDGESSRSVFSDISANIIARIYSVLKSPVTATDYPAVKLLKTFYGKCILTSQKELFMNALQEIGDWLFSNSRSQRLSQHIWGEIAFNLTYGMFLEYNLVSVNLTFANSDRWMLNVDYPQFVKVALSSGTLSVLDEIERDITRVAAALGIDNIQSGLADLRIFMASAVKYAKATMSSAARGFYSLTDLKANFTHLDVLKRLPSLLKPTVAVDDSEMIYVSNMMYLKKVNELIRDSTVRTQESHLVLMVVRSLSSMIGTDTILEKYCVKLTGKLFPHFVRHLYSSAFVSDSKIASAAKIVSGIQDSLLRVIDSKFNKTTKDKVMDKVRKLKFIWSNRKEITDGLDGIFRSFDEDSSFLGYVKTGIRNLKMATYVYLHQRVNDSLVSFIERYTEVYLGVNAFYYDDDIFIPPSALHDSIFDPNLPVYVSYAGLGLIVGHELIHSLIEVDDLVNSTSFKNMEKCVVIQFNKFRAKYSVGRVNSVVTQEENIADYGGFKVAYHAFMEWYNRSKDSKEKRLPGLQALNEKQTFWVTAATNWCRKVSTGFVPTSIDKHAPPEYRIDGQFSNIPEFAKDFNCPENSLMNPKEKCSLW